jgi:hypothetical protein
VARRRAWLLRTRASARSRPYLVPFFALTAWFRVHLMDDVANREYFYGATCTLCTDDRLTVQRNSLMTQ